MITEIKPQICPCLLCQVDFKRNEKFALVQFIETKKYWSPYKSMRDTEDVDSINDAMLIGPRHRKDIWNTSIVQFVDF